MLMSDPGHLKGMKLGINLQERNNTSRTLVAEGQAFRPPITMMFACVAHKY